MKSAGTFISFYWFMPPNSRLHLTPLRCASAAQVGFAVRPSAT
jgi:hypothetical protein